MNTSINGLFSLKVKEVVCENGKSCVGPDPESPSPHSLGPAVTQKHLIKEEAPTSTCAFPPCTPPPYCVPRKTLLIGHDDDLDSPAPLILPVLLVSLPTVLSCHKKAWIQIPTLSQNRCIHITFCVSTSPPSNRVISASLLGVLQEIYKKLQHRNLSCVLRGKASL